MSTSTNPPEEKPPETNINQTAGKFSLLIGRIKARVVNITTNSSIPKTVLVAIYLITFAIVSITLYIFIPPIFQKLNPSPTPTKEIGGKSVYFMFVLDASSKMSQSYQGGTKWDEALKTAEDIMLGSSLYSNYGLVLIGGDSGMSSNQADLCNQPKEPVIPIALQSGEILPSESLSRAKVWDYIHNLSPAGGGRYVNAIASASSQLAYVAKGTKHLVFIVGSSDDCDEDDEWKQLVNVIKTMKDVNFIDILIVEEEPSQQVMDFIEDVGNINNSGQEIKIQQINAHAQRDQSERMENVSNILGRYRAYYGPTWLEELTNIPEDLAPVTQIALSTPTHTITPCCSISETPTEVALPTATFTATATASATPTPTPTSTTTATWAPPPPTETPTTPPPPPQPTNTPTTPPPPPYDTATPNCDPHYPTICVAPPPPDLDCSDIPLYTNFAVVGGDPHGFDKDGNGIGCEK